LRQAARSAGKAARQNRAARIDFYTVTTALGRFGSSAHLRPSSPPVRRQRADPADAGGLAGPAPGRPRQRLHRQIPVLGHLRGGPCGLDRDARGPARLPIFYSRPGGLGSGSCKGTRHGRHPRPGTPRGRPPSRPGLHPGPGRTARPAAHATAISRRRLGLATRGTPTAGVATRGRGRLRGTRPAPPPPHPRGDRPPPRSSPDRALRTRLYRRHPFPGLVHEQERAQCPDRHPGGRGAPDTQGPRTGGRMVWPARPPPRHHPRAPAHHVERPRLRRGLRPSALRRRAHAL
jgi:hypothetical protein